MRAKEKAEYLVDMFCRSLIKSNGTASGAIQCALIAVDEIINSKPFGDTGQWYELVSDRLEDQRDYWQEVKNHILEM